MGPFVADIKSIREKARARISEGAVTSANRTDNEQVIKVLNEVLATELVCSLRYKSHYFAAEGIHSEAVKAEFLEHSKEEQQHADQVAERISQLNGQPDLNPATLTRRSHAEYSQGADLVAMIEEDLIAERVAIELYTEIVRWLGDADPTSRRMMEEILAKEEEHADDLVNLRSRLPKV
jgi:bacterioferritin